MRQGLSGLFVLIVAVAGIALVVSALSSGSAEAGKGSITVPDGFFGRTVMATVNPGGTGVYVHAECFQNGSLVFEQYAPVNGDNQAMIGLGPTQLWTGGDADCTAEEGYFGRNGRWHTMASTTFHVNG